MICVVAGEKLFTQEEMIVEGHAIEFRVNAEDPTETYPSTRARRGGAFSRGPGIRIDSHVYSLYDSTLL